MKRTSGIAATLIALALFSAPLFAEEAEPEPPPVSAPSSQEAPSPAPAVSVPEPPAAPEETVWVDDALPADAKTEGDWVWDSSTVSSGAKSHGHAPAKGIQSHGFTADPIRLSSNSLVTQQVWCDPKDPPKGIMLKFKLETGEEVGVYWEGEEEVFAPKEDEEVWYYGILPELGKWSTLEVLAEDLGLEEEKVIGLKFVTFDGRVLWDKTTIRKAPPAEEVESFPDLPEPESPTDLGGSPQ